jgi:DNA invertase Pin-like site-specific DNA recombinase
MQLGELREFAQRRGWEVTAEYVDIGVSGAKKSRPELNRMLKAADAPAFNAVVCWKLDRLGRSLKHLVTVIEDLSCYSVTFVSLRDIVRQLAGMTLLCSIEAAHRQFCQIAYATLSSQLLFYLFECFQPNCSSSVQTL